MVPRFVIPKKKENRGQKRKRGKNKRGVLFFAKQTIRY